jgi:hypothetical protein
MAHRQRRFERPLSRLGSGTSYTHRRWGHVDLCGVNYRTGGDLSTPKGWFLLGVGIL